MSSPATPGESIDVLLVGTTEWVDPFSESLDAATAASVRTVPAADSALGAVRDTAVDCIVTEYTLEESTGVRLVEAIRDETADLPVILCTADGSETVASEAIGAGVTDYIALDGGGDERPGDGGDERPGDRPGDRPDDRSADGFEDRFADLCERVTRSVRESRRTSTNRNRARQFDTIFHDPRTATWVLDPDGSLARVNRTALDLIDRDVEPQQSRPFWTLPWWSEPDGLQADVRRIVTKAIAGDVGSAVLTRPVDGDGSQVVELAARPVHDERGHLVSVVVDGIDITERVRLERDLRESEELHRVTLNNMTDTVLITDEAGRYTYICPNVHFIFGYTVEEIRELGTIENLLGEELFDREDLADAGVLKNIECTATDKAGREHTLLVNVREVSIQGGTLLYSCRDITKRKQREEALATLQATAREFLYAETPQEIAQHVVTDTPSVLDVDASAVYLFDADANELHPATYSAEMEALNGPLPTVPADGQSLPSYSFVENEPRFFADVHDAERLENRATELRSGAYIPLGDHGVFVCGTDTVGTFDEVRRELADLLAATAEAALDRVTRETRLREQDRELQRRNEELSTLDRINETIREIDQALVRAETREEIDHTVCELLTADDRFSFAWIGAADPATESVEPRAWAGAEEGYLDSCRFPVDASGCEPAGQTAATTDVTMVTNVAARLRDEPWRKHALQRDYLSVLSIPLVYNDLAYGVLTVYGESQNAFADPARAVLAELGETIASAISAIERKNALLTTLMTRVEFGIDDPSFVFQRLAREANCTIAYQGGIQQTADGLSVFVTVTGAPLDAVERATTELIAIEDVQRISTRSSGGVLRLGLPEFFALELADHGAVVRTASADPNGTTLVIDLPESVEVRHVDQILRETFADVTLQAKQTFDRTSEYSLHSQFLEQVTDRQLEVAQTAYFSGFFESPRESTGEDVADTLGISPPAFYQHIRTVERKVFATLFAESSMPAMALSNT